MNGNICKESNCPNVLPIGDFHIYCMNHRSCIINCQLVPCQFCENVFENLRNNIESIHPINNIWNNIISRLKKKRKKVFGDGNIWANIEDETKFTLQLTKNPSGVNSDNGLSNMLMEIRHLDNQEKNKKSSEVKTCIISKCINKISPDDDHPECLMHRSCYNEGKFTPCNYCERIFNLMIQNIDTIHPLNNLWSSILLKLRKKRRRFYGDDNFWNNQEDEERFTLPAQKTHLSSIKSPKSSNSSLKYENVKPLLPDPTDAKYNEQSEGYSHHTNESEDKIGDRSRSRSAHSDRASERSQSGASKGSPNRSNSTDSDGSSNDSHGSRSRKKQSSRSRSGSNSSASNSDHSESSDKSSIKSQNAPLQHGNQQFFMEDNNQNSSMLPPIQQNNRWEIDANINLPPSNTYNQQNQVPRNPQHFGGDIQRPFMAPNNMSMPHNNMPMPHKGSMPHNSIRPIPQTNLPNPPNNMHLHSDMPLNPNNMSMNRNNMPMNHNNMPMNPNNMPMNPNNMPMNPNNVPMNQNNMPMNQNNMPMNQNNVPMNPNNIPMNQNNMPMNRNNMPMNQNNMPMNQNNMPMNQNNMPMNQNNMSMNQNNIPINQNNMFMNQNNMPMNKNNFPMNPNNLPMNSNSMNIPNNNTPMSFNNSMPQNNMAISQNNIPVSSNDLQLQSNADKNEVPNMWLGIIRSAEPLNSKIAKPKSHLQPQLIENFKPNDQRSKVNQQQQDLSNYSRAIGIPPFVGVSDIPVPPTPRQPKTCAALYCKTVLTGDDCHLHCLQHRPCFIDGKFTPCIFCEKLYRSLLQNDVPVPHLKNIWDSSIVQMMKIRQRIYGDTNIWNSKEDEKHYDLIEKEKSKKALNVLEGVEKSYRICTIDSYCSNQLIKNDHHMLCTEHRPCITPEAQIVPCNFCIANFEFFQSNSECSVNNPDPWSAALTEVKEKRMKKFNDTLIWRYSEDNVRFSQSEVNLFLREWRTKSIALVGPNLYDVVGNANNFGQSCPGKLVRNVSYCENGDGSSKSACMLVSRLGGNLGHQPDYVMIFSFLQEFGNQVTNPRDINTLIEDLISTVKKAYTTWKNEHPATEFIWVLPYPPDFYRVSSPKSVEPRPPSQLVKNCCEKSKLFYSCVTSFYHIWKQTIPYIPCINLSQIFFEKSEEALLDTKNILISWPHGYTTDGLSMSKTFSDRLWREFYDMMFEQSNVFTPELRSKDMRLLGIELFPKRNYYNKMLIHNSNKWMSENIIFMGDNMAHDMMSVRNCFIPKVKLIAKSLFNDPFSKFVKDVDQVLESDASMSILLLSPFHEKTIVSFNPKNNNSPSSLFLKPRPIDMSLCLPSVLRSTKSWKEKYPSLKIVWVLPLPINFDLFNTIADNGGNSPNKKREMYHSMMYYSSIKSLTRKWLFNIPEVAMISLVDLFLTEEQKDSFIDGRENLKWPSDYTWNGLNVLPAFADIFWKHLSKLIEGMKEPNYVMEVQLEMREKITKNEIPKIAQLHPMYNLMWEKFWADRSLVLRSIDIDPQKFDFSHEWNYRWNSICNEFGQIHNCFDYNEFVGPMYRETFSEFLKPHIGNLQQRIASNTPEKKISIHSQGLTSSSASTRSTNVHKRSFNDTGPLSPCSEKKLKTDAYSPKTPPRVQKDSSRYPILANNVFTKLIKFINHLDFLGPAVKYMYRLFMNNLNNEKNSTSLFENSFHVIVIQASLSMMLSLFTQSDIPYQAIDMAMCIESCQELLLYIGAPDESDASIRMMLDKKLPDGMMPPESKSSLQEVQRKPLLDISLSEIPLPSAFPTPDTYKNKPNEDLSDANKSLIDRDDRNDTMQPPPISESLPNSFSKGSYTANSTFDKLGVSSEMDSDMRTLDSPLDRIGNYQQATQRTMDSDMRFIPGTNILSESQSTKPDFDMRVYPYDQTESVETKNTQPMNSDLDMRSIETLITGASDELISQHNRLKSEELSEPQRPAYINTNPSEPKKDVEQSSSQKDIPNDASKVKLEKLKESILIDTQSSDPVFAKNSKLVLEQMLPHFDSVADLTKGYTLPSVEKHIKIALNTIGSSLSAYDMNSVMRYISKRQGRPEHSETSMATANSNDFKPLEKSKCEDKLKAENSEANIELKKKSNDFDVQLSHLDSIAFLTKGFPLSAVGPHVKVALQNMGKTVTDEKMEKIMEYIAVKHKEMFAAESIVRKDITPKPALSNQSLAVPIPVPKPVIGVNQAHHNLSQKTSSVPNRVPLPVSNPLKDGGSNNAKSYISGSQQSILSTNNPLNSSLTREYGQDPAKVTQKFISHPLTGWNVRDPTMKIISTSQEVSKKEEAPIHPPVAEAQNLNAILAKLQNLDPKEQASFNNYLAKIAQLEGQVINLQKAVGDKKKKSEIK